MSEPTKFEDQLFRYIFDSVHNPEVFKDLKGGNGIDFALAPIDEPELFGLIGDAKNYDEARNRLIFKMQKEGDSRLVRDAIAAFNKLYGDPEKGESGTYKEGSFPSVARLKPKEFSADKMSVDDLTAYGQLFADKSKLDLGGVLDKIFMTPIGKDDSESDVFPNRVKRMMNELMDGPNSRESFVRDMGYTPAADEDYISKDLHDKLWRLYKMRTQKEKPLGDKVVESFIAPNSVRSKENGLDPSLNDVAFDLVSPLADIAVAAASKGQSLPFQVGAGSALDVLLSIPHDYIDSLNTEHIYSSGDGEDKDIRVPANAADVLKLENIGPKLFNAIPGLFLGAFGKLPFRTTAQYKSLANIADSAFDKLFGMKKIRKEADVLQESIQREKDALSVLQKEAKSGKLPADDLAWNRKETQRVSRELENLENAETELARKSADADSKKKKAKDAMSLLLGTGAVRSGAGANSYVVDFVKGMINK